MGDLLDPDPGGNKSPKMRQKMLKNFINVFILFSGNILPPWTRIRIWIRIRIEADADPGSGSALQPMRINVTALINPKILFSLGSKY